MLKKSIISSLSLAMLVAVVFIYSVIQDKQLASIPKYAEFPTVPLIDLADQPYRFDKDKIKLITFFYSRCPDICPLTINDLTKLHAELKRKELLDEVDIIAITLDPEHDTVPVLSQYSQRFRLPADHWYILRSSSEDIMQLTDDLGYYREDVAGYWSHSTTMYLVDYENVIRNYHHMSGPNEPIDIQKIVKDISLINKEYEKVVNGWYNEIFFE